MISMARRARGIDAGRNPLTRLRLFGSTAFTLLVGAIRRGTRLAVAMDARASTPRRRGRWPAANASEPRTVSWSPARRCCPAPRSRSASLSARSAP